MIRTIFIALLIAFSSTSVFAGIKIPMGEREVLNKVYDLPDTDEFKSEHGNFIDVATLHKEYNIAYILPLYVIEEPRLVLFDEKADSFYDLPQDKVDAILASQKIDKEKLNKLPFYTRYGGKIVALLIIGLLVWGVIISRKDDAEEEARAEAAPKEV
ncbi:hypothetical protein [Chitinophaga filiformis]|uniref:Uncharacterized protein n=1 Tax=Chitinophaga filiformis TaxID=104663 RepID=A0A1G7LR79_CHIFI|nr:hypothetical protein [Chitinophaga filiformis]SDF52017.1 hypothetical protein SAMN04488121_102160 [Chitinophaga filiformis]